MLLVEAMDEGPLLAQSAYSIPTDATTPSLTEALIYISDKMLKEVVPRYLSGHASPKSQAEASMLDLHDTSYSRRLTKEDGRIDWTKPAVALEREVRAFLDWPKSTTEFGHKEVIITKASVLQADGEPGQVIIKDKKLVVCCARNALQILRLKPAGKAEMDAQAFLAGYRHLLQ